MAARLARNSLHSASGRVVATLAWLLVTPPLVHALGSEGFGVWSLFYALTVWLNAMDLGFSQVALRFGAAARARDAGAEAGEYATLAVLGYLVLGVLWLAVALVAREPALDLLRIHGPARAQAELVFVAGSLVFVLGGLATTTSSALQGWDRFDLANVVTLTASLAQVAGLALVLATGAGLGRCLAAVAAGWFVAFGVGLLLLARGVPAFRWGAPAPAVRRLREAMSFGLPLQIANGLGVAHQQLGKLLLIRVVSLAAVVPYELGLRVCTASFAFAQLVLVSMIPEASVLHARDQNEQLQALHRRAGRFVTGAASMLTAALIASAAPLFHAWLGEPNAEAALALRGLAVAAYAAVVGGVSGAITRGVGRTTLELEWSGLALVLHAVLALFLVPRMGLAGALVAVAVANVVGTLWFALRLGRALRWPVARMLWEPFGVPVLAVVAGVACGSFVTGKIAAPWLSLVASSAVAALAALAVLLAMRHIALDELARLTRRRSAT
jgi:O-antigen/teichoic acid export membrane protein